MEPGPGGASSAGFDAASVLEHAQVSVIVTDLTGVIVDCNRQAEILYGRPREELLGADSPTFAVDAIPDELIATIAARLVTGKTWEGEFRIRRSDGMIATVRAIDSPIFGPDGEFRGVVSIALDITKRKRVERRLETQYAVARVLAEAPTLESVSQSLLAGIGEALDWEVAALWAPSGDGKVLRCVDLWHPENVQVPAFEELSRRIELEPGLGMPGRVWASGRPDWVADVVEDPNFPRAAAAIADGLHCAFAIPVQAAGELLAVMEFLGAEVEEPDAELLRQMVALGQQIGLFLQRLRAERREQEARVRLEVLASVGELLTVELDLEERLQSVVRVLLSEFADLCALWLVAPDGTSRLVTIAHADPDHDETLRSLSWPSEPPPVGSPIDRALAHREPVLVHGDEARTFWQGLLPDDGRASAERLRPGSVVCVPLFDRDGPQGVLCLGRDEPAIRYTEGDVVAGRELAHRIGMAIESWKRFEEQRNAAEVLQRSLLPNRLPDTPFARLASRYVPGSSELTIGGDWFDAIVRADAQLVVAVGDVAGHGLRAAVTMGRARHSLEFCIYEGLSPSVMLQRMNHFLYGAGDAGLVTAIVASIDHATGELVLAGAGHPPPAVRTPDGSTFFVEVANGPPLGAIESPVYGEARITLAPGSTVVLYTDGLVERRGEPLTTGLARLVDEIRAAPADPQDLADHLLHTLLQPGSTDDDVAILVVGLEAG